MPVTEPTVIRTRKLGGTVSDIAPDEASKATSSPGFGAALHHLWETALERRPPCPRPSSRKYRRRDTSLRAAHKTGRRAIRRGSRPRKSIIARAVSTRRLEERADQHEHLGTPRRRRWDMPSSIRPITTVSGSSVVKPSSGSWERSFWSRTTNGPSSAPAT